MLTFLSSLSQHKTVYKNGWLVVGISPIVTQGIIGGMPSAGVFLRDPNPDLREFRENHEKL